MVLIARFCIALGILGIAASSALAQSFPARPVRIIVPFPPGGTTDILAREVVSQIQPRWNVPVIVDNRAGASGTIGSEQVARSVGDPYTLLITATHHAINPSLQKKLPYDTKKDFTCLALIAIVPNVLFVNAAYPAKSVADLIQMAKAKPGSISFASTGIGGANHLAGELFKVMAGINMVHVPYKGAAPAMNDVIAGHVPVMFDGLTGVIPQMQSGRIRALGVTTLKRVPLVPDIPTIDEAGVKGFEVLSWFGLYGPAHLAPADVTKISGDINAVLASSEIQSRFAKQAAYPGTLSQTEFTRFVESEIDKWGDVIKKAGIPQE